MRTIEETIRVATRRALVKMQDQVDRPIHTFKKGEINGWSGDALATYIYPVVIRALNRRKAAK